MNWTLANFKISQYVEELGTPTCRILWLSSHVGVQTPRIARVQYENGDHQSEVQTSMRQLNPAQTATLKDWFLPDRPGPLIGLHLINTGIGACFVDRWPNPRAVLVNVAGNYSLLGEPSALGPDHLKDRIHGFVETSEDFEPLLKTTFPNLKIWNRVVLELVDRPEFSLPEGVRVRPIVSSDAYLVWGFNPKIEWISRTWGGPSGLASSGYAWGAFINGRLVSVACSFFVGDHYEDVGVVTDPALRGKGLSVACAGSLCNDIFQRNRRPSWNTSPDNAASLRVAQKLGFTIQRHDQLYVIGIPIPE